ncbi:hypothetical protein D1007_53715 [Hordeum vulgare]|nr:hypothetical protein D1007_53715 [Hordeum vulgare]
MSPVALLEVRTPTEGEVGAEADKAAVGVWKRASGISSVAPSSAAKRAPSEVRTLTTVEKGRRARKRRRRQSGVWKSERMDKIVNIHYVDKEAFMNVAIVDKYEEVLTFLDSPTYEEEAVASSIDKSLEVFASTVVNAPLHVDLSQPIVDDLSPYNVVAPIVEHKVEVQVNEYPQYEFGGSAPIKDDGHESDEEYERQHNIVGDVEAQVRHDDMDPDIVYQRACVDESDDEGPENELDEDGFTEIEAEWYTKITGRDHKVPLFCDVSLADKALVDGGMSKTIEARMFPSSTPNAISTSYLKKDSSVNMGVEIPPFS